MTTPSTEPMTLEQSRAAIKGETKKLLLDLIEVVQKRIAELAAQGHHTDAICPLLMTLGTNFCGQMIGIVAPNYPHPESFVVNALPEITRQVTARALAIMGSKDTIEITAVERGGGDAPDTKH